MCTRPSAGLMRSRAAAVLLLALVVPVAGCITPEEPTGPTPLEDPFDRPTTPDRSWEAMRITVEPERHYRIAVPIPIADQADVAAWAEDIEIEGTADVVLGQERGRDVFWVEGEAPATVTWTRIKTSADEGDCCAEDFLGSAWTTGPEVGATDSLPFAAERGAGRLTLVYRAVSNYCGADEDRTGTFDAMRDVTPTLQYTTTPGGRWCA